MQLRPYQRECLDSLWSWFAAGGEGNPLVVACVGAGKSLMMAQFIKEAAQQYEGTRILSMAGQRELISQNLEKLRTVWPAAPAGVFSAGLSKREINSQILFGSIQSLYRKAYEIQRCDLMLVDECHQISRKEGAMWHRFIKEIREINPHMRVIGFTGTEWRMDSGALTEGDDALFSEVVHRVKMLDLIEQGYLVPLVPRKSEVQIDLSGVRTRAGEYAADELEQAADLVTPEAVREIVAQGADRRTWLIFCSGVKHAFHVRDEIRKYGITCETVTGETPATERDQILKDLQAGKIRAVTNANCLTTGVDVPAIDLLGMLRPTKSSGLVVQMSGRGARLSPDTGKVDCLFLDLASILKSHGCVDQIKPPRRKGPKGEGDAPSRNCPECETKCLAAARVCPVCGHEFPAHAPKIEAFAASDAVLSNQIKPIWSEVQEVSYSKHRGRNGRPDCLLVTYRIGLMECVSEYINLWRDDAAGRSGRKWWARRAPGQTTPSTLDEALRLAPALPRPAAIAVKPNGKYQNVVAHRFA